MHFVANLFRIDVFSATRVQFPAGRAGRVFAPDLSPGRV